MPKRSNHFDIGQVLGQFMNEANQASKRIDSRYSMVTRRAF
jgi:hypothetical protein